MCIRDSSIVYIERLFGTYNPPHTLQIYIGALRGPNTTAVLSNRNILNELHVGMLVALTTQHEGLPSIGEVTGVPDNPCTNSNIQLHYYIQERAPHKPKWLRFFRKSERWTGTACYHDVLLYDFTLTKMGALRKSTRKHNWEN